MPLKMKPRSTDPKKAWVKTIVSRRRPGELQRDQKATTRKKLLDAARAVFEHYSYSSASVDLIVDQAGISRTTFYRHFDGKLPIALALFANMAPQLQGQWKELLAISEPSSSDVQSWLIRHVETAESDRVLISILREIDATEADAQPHVLHYHEALLRLMWGDHLDSHDEQFPELKAKSLLLLLQIDQFLYTLCVRNWDIDRAAFIRAMSGMLHEFLQFRLSARSGIRNAPYKTHAV